MSDLTYSQKYYAKNKDNIKKYINEKTACECGTVVARLNMAKHRRTNKHKNRMLHKEYLKTLEK